jgi:DNA-binding GntR family transcriptional regulator
VPIYTLRYHQLLKPSNIKSSVAEHEQIADALLDGDGDRAERVMRMHVRNSGDLILQRLAAE